MKKNISIATIAIGLVISGCGSAATEISPNNSINIKKELFDTKKATQIVIGNSYSASNNIEFSLFKIGISDKLQATSGKGSFYQADSGYNYIDVIITLTNKGNSDFSIRDSISGFFTASDGNTYEDVLMAVESANDRIDQFGSVKPLATSKIHLGYEVPSDVTAGKAYFDFSGLSFVADYDINVETSSKMAIEINQKVTVDDVASFMLLNTNYTADVLPSDTSRFYSHYTVDDPSNDTFFVVYCDITNESSTAIDADEMISAKAIFDGKFEYSANMVLEKKDGTGFDYANITSVKPLETRKAVLMFEIPKKVQDMNYELQIYFYGNEYSYKR